MTQREIDVAWSKAMAELAVDRLVTANIVAKAEFARAAAIAAEEISVRLAMQDRPDAANWRYISN